MPRRSRPKDAISAAKLEQRLVLLAWLNERLGYTENRDLLADMKQTDEGFDAEGRSHIYARLASRPSGLKDISPDDLARYDANIRDHLTAMNRGRLQPISLRYFQYLAALYTEIFLDWYFNRRGALLRSLNDLVRRRNVNRSARDARETEFAAADLCKLAFWMATGSGKTLILHLNYRQFLHYNSKALDNILLITPNEGLSDQHLAELQASNIPASRFELNKSSLLGSGRNAIEVTEITKLVEEKRGGGMRVPVEAFEGHNLIFVDEGHKGSGGDAWRKVRDALGETGFTFEYSATFGQALTAAKNDALTAEYGKAIAFDYSYRYFYGDGYGKDFHILNLREETTADRTDRLLLANLLSFYEQHLVFAEQAEAFQPYNLARPLWTFVGGSVNAVYTEKRQSRSDILTVVRFLHRLIADATWATDALEQLLKGNSDLRDADGNDIFADKFEYLRGRDAVAVYQDILARVLHASAGSGLHLCDIRGSSGELGLKVGGAEDYFGLIYIGDTTKFKNLVEADDAGIVIEEDAFARSLFDRLNDPGTTVEVLIGAKKFIEGWDSWRVSNMGLLNIGRSEGSQIIQLFGRGVRLRGRDMTLKRSSALDGRHPDCIKLLETLNIFAVRANYMAHFRDYLEREGVELDGVLELPLFVKPNEDFLNKGLVIPRVNDGRSFVAGKAVMLKPDPNVRPVSVDMSAKVHRMDSSEGGPIDAEASAGTEGPIPPESLALVDWESVYLDLLAYKEQKGWRNLLVQPDAPRKILAYRSESGALYSLIAEDAVVQPQSFDDLKRLQEAATNLVRKYADALYWHRREQWNSANLVYKTLDEREPNLRFNVSDADGSPSGQYLVRVPRSETALIQKIEALIADSYKLYDDEAAAGALSRIHFDRHLYQPLLLSDVKVEVSPPGLNESEQQFVRDLREYWNEEQGNALVGADLFLLRNQSRGQGVGFFENSGFYPDFILWIKADDAQHIVFVEPHGMLQANAYQHDDKARLHERLPALARDISQRSNVPNVSLDSFIVSATPYKELHKRYDDGSWDRERFAQAHILFPERTGAYDYLAKIIEGAPSTNIGGRNDQPSHGGGTRFL